MTHLDNAAETALSRPHNDSQGSVASPRMSCGSRSTGPRWHCVWTHPQREYQALQGLVEQRWDCYLPQCIERADRINRRPDRIVPLFPRYLFVQFSAEHDPWGSIQHTAGVGGLIRHAPDRPTPVPPGIVEHLLLRTSFRSVVDDPGDAPRPDIPLGSSVEVRDGPLAGLGGLVALSAPGRVAVLLRLFGRTLTVDLPRTSLEVVP